VYLHYNGQYCLWERLRIQLPERKPPQIYCAKKIRTMETVTLSSRYAHGMLTVRSGYAQVKLMAHSRYSHGALTIRSGYAHDLIMVRNKRSLRVLKRTCSLPYRAFKVIANVDNPTDTQRRTSDLLLAGTWLSIWCKLCVAYRQGDNVYSRSSLIKFYDMFILRLQIQCKNWIYHICLSLGSQTADSHNLR
jgi:hypothetical protein